ncbi:Smr/MutS family protein [Shinella daejeonensis]|uniref:Smr/MutS family protein n=1 Tax=Shinella daejeonensis TaxID=659017 RepID=UPI0020C7759C|nr:Smr/MutS family protein [Shinella daejeonensis]MCP8895841.1 Smr/MutS family protein [Shinella daejeonensis]
MARDKPLSTIDRILWGKVARSARPLPGRLEALTEFEAAFAAAEPEKPVQPEKSAKAALRTETAIALTVAPGGQERRHHPLELPVKRKIARGRLPLEARIDLHGMIQSEAHGFLLGFLIRAQERGLRHVLVITGKGASFGSDGALKRAVPLWFSLPEFRSLISSYETAARNHGGEGALYVRLSRPSGERR